MNQKRKFGLIIFYVFLLLFFGYSTVMAATRYVATTGTDSGSCTNSDTPCQTIQYAVTQMASGDILQLADGTYSGSSNRFTDTYAPPNGPGTGSGDARFTIVKAENEGQVTVDGGSSYHVINWYNEHDYIKFEGIKFTSSITSDDLIHIDNTSSDHIYFRRCGFWRSVGGGSSTVWLTSLYNLFEECYFWGAGRYGLNLRTPGDYTIVRRCVFRMDDQDAGGLVIAAAIAYEHDYVEWQNNIVLDADRDYWNNYTYPYGGLITHKVADGDGTHFNLFRGNIVLNVDTHYTGSGIYGSGIILDGDTTTDSLLENNVVWETQGHGMSAGSGVNNVAANNTVGEVDDSGGVVGDGIRGFNATGNSVTNSIVYSVRDDGLYQANNNDYNDVFGNGDDFDTVTNEPEPNGVTYDPTANGLKYIVRIENGSNLKTAGSAGGQIGAQVVKRYGIDGTFYGEDISGNPSTDYKNLSSVDLWPFPYEAQIRSDLRSYTPSGGGFSGVRGFASDGQTLTNYIWSYLGNTAPPFNVAGEPGNQKVTVSWDANPDVAVTANPANGYYKVFISTSSSGPYTLVYNGQGVSNSPTALITTDGSNPLVNDTPYYFVVTAVNNSNESAISEEVTATPKPVEITNPTTGFYVNNDNDDAYLISGRANASADVEILVNEASFPTPETTQADGSGIWSKNVDFTGVSEGPISLTVVSNAVPSAAVAGTYDKTSPSAPTITGSSLTSDNTPTWTWSSGGGGNGTFRYKLDDSDLSSEATETTDTSCTQGTALSDGNHTMYVQERDEAGNWSNSGSLTTEVDTVPPLAPTGLMITGVE